MRNISTVLFFLFSTLVFSQQSIDLLTLSGRFGLPSTYEGNVKGRAVETGGLVNLRIPIVLDSSNIWYSKLTYLNNSVVSSRTFNDTVANPIIVHGFILQTGWVKKLSKQRSVQLMFVPRLMGDMKNVNVKNLQFGAVALYEKRFNKKLKLKFGAMYNQEISGAFAIPLVDVDWQISGKWSLSGLVPIFSKIKYTFSEKTSSGLGHFALITSYRLGDENYRNEYIERTSIDAFAFVRQRIKGNIHIEGRVGYALGRIYDQYAEGETVDFRFSLFTWGNNRVIKNHSFEDGAFVNLRLIYNLPIN